MQQILQHIQSVEGVVGSALYGSRGELLAHLFPPLVEQTALEGAGDLVKGCLGLGSGEAAEQVDLRYGEGRILIRPFSGGMILLLCARTVSLQVVGITLSMAAKKMTAPLETIPAPVGTQKVPIADQQASTLLRLPVTRLASREASSSFDSLGMIALSQETAVRISTFYGASFKKLTLTGQGASGIFPAMVVHDLDPQFDGAIIVGPAIERKLGIAPGTEVDVTIA